MREGREHLEHLFEQPIRGFVPPWNAYDRTTSLLSKTLGFEFLSAGAELIVGEDVLPNVPRICTLQNARTVLEQARCFGRLSPVVVIVFHPDEFVEFYPPDRSILSTHPLRALPHCPH